MDLSEFDLLTFCCGSYKLSLYFILWYLLSVCPICPVWFLLKIVLFLLLSDYGPHICSFVAYPCEIASSLFAVRLYLICLNVCCSNRVYNKQCIWINLPINEFLSQSLNHLYTTNPHSSIFLLSSNKSQWYIYIFQWYKLIVSTSQWVFYIM